MYPNFNQLAIWDPLFGHTRNKMGLELGDAPNRLSFQLPLKTSPKGHLLPQQTSSSNPPLLFNHRSFHTPVVFTGFLEGFYRDPYIIHLNIATCKWWFPFILVLKKQTTCFNWLLHGDLLTNLRSSGKICSDP